ncbi:TPA: plasmid SOS inhibition protein A [Kluyvera intermedia]|nr:plasmid SOS inhibition protein A [Bifidobacterium longum]HAU8265983.1 plasmid SOS inhibition protein A [Kluyvera intermedia]
MIPNHFSLVAVNPFQQAVQLAIIDVESSLMAGKRLGRFPWAMALLRRLRAEQAGRITAKDVMCATSGYEPGSRDGYNKEKYIEALDRLIETRGDVCPMPLSGSTVDMYFPEVRFRERERHHRRFDVAASRRSRQREKEQHQKRRRYQTQVAQAEIDLAFVTPAGLSAWYKRQERQGIYDDDLINMVQSWCSRFRGLPYDWLYSGQPLWAIIEQLEAPLAGRSDGEHWLDSLSLPNKLRDMRRG